MKTRKKNGKVYSYPKYICSTYCRSGRDNASGCGYHAVQQNLIVDVIVRKLREAILVGDTKQRLEQAVRQLLKQRSKPDPKRHNQLKRRIRDMEKQIDRAADRLPTAPENLMDVLGPKLTAMKNQQKQLEAQLADLQSTQRTSDIDAQVHAVVDRLRSLGSELEKAKPARLRELLQQGIGRVELKFDRIPRGKRVECPLISGEIHFRTESDLFGSVNRGEPLRSSLYKINIAHDDYWDARLDLISLGSLAT